MAQNDMSISCNPKTAAHSDSSGFAPVVHDVLVRICEFVAHSDNAETIKHTPSVTNTSQDEDDGWKPSFNKGQDDPKPPAPLGFDTSFFSLRKTCKKFKEITSAIIGSHLRTTKTEPFKTIEIGRSVKDFEALRGVSLNAEWSGYVEEINIHVLSYDLLDSADAEYLTLDDRRDGLRISEAEWQQRVDQFELYREKLRQNQNMKDAVAWMAHGKNFDLLTTMIGRLKNLRTVRLISLPRYVEGFNKHIDLEVDHLTEPVLKSIRLVTNLLKHQSMSQVSSLETDMSMWAWPHQNMKRVRLQLSGHVRYDEYYRWSKILAKCTNLEELELIGGKNEMLEQGDSATLEDLLDGQAWPRLRKFSLKYWIVSGPELLDFFNCHPQIKSLELVLNELDMGDSSWRNIVTRTAVLLGLEHAKVVCLEDQTDNDPHWPAFFAQYGKTLQPMNNREVVCISDFFGTNIDSNHL